MNSPNPGSGSSDAMRRVIVGATLALVLESALYSAVAPLLPHYVDEFDLSKASAGFLTASYTFGMLVGAVAAGALADRVGPRQTVFAGLLGLGVTTFAFGLAPNVVVLDATRLLQGFTAGMVWAGVITWLIISAPDERRGQALGGAFAGAVVGTLLGPVIGTVAVGVGDNVTFGLVGVLTMAFGLWISRLPSAAARAPTARVSLRSALSNRSFAVVFAVATITGLLAGLTNVLIPLRLSDAGAASIMVGAVFIAMGVSIAVLSPLAGRRADLVGERPPLLVGLAVAAVGLILLAFVENKWSIAIMSVVVGGWGLALISVPNVSLLTRVSEAAGLTAGATAAVTNITFAGGETVGASMSAVTAGATSDAVPMLGLSAICVIALLTIAYSKLIPRSAVSEGVLERTT